MNKLPKDFHKDLIEDSIQSIANLIYSARVSCLDEHDEMAGDTNWSYGCRARDWTRQVLRVAAADTEKYPYFSIIEDVGQKFVMAISGIPIKFFKDDAEEPTERVRKQSLSELEQLSLFEFNGIDTPEDVAWRFVVETNPLTLEITRIVFVGLDQHEETLCYYDVPLHRNVTKIHDIMPTYEEGVELSTPSVQKKKKQKQNVVVNDK